MEMKAVIATFGSMSVFSLNLLASVIKAVDSEIQPLTTL